MPEDAAEDGEWSRVLAQDFGRYSLGMAVPAVLEIVAVVVFTRLFAPDAYGRYALTIVATTIVVTVTSGWIRQSVLRFGPEVADRRLLQTVTWATLGVAALLLAVGIVGYLVGGQGLGPYRPFYLAGLGVIVAKGVFETVRTILQARLDSRAATAYQVLQAIARFAIALALAVYVLDSIVGWVWGVALGALLATVIAVGASPSLRARPQIDRELLGRLARFGFPMIGWLLATSLLTFADRAVLELFRGSHAVGLYASNYDLAFRGLSLLFAPFIQAAHPIVMNAWAGDNPAEIERLVTRFTRYLLVIGGLATAWAIVLSRPLSAVLLGAEFRPGAVVIPFVAAGQFLWFVSMIGHKGLEVRERTRLMLGGVAVTLTLNLILNVLLVPSFGYLGAAVATFLSYALYPCIVYLVSRQFIPWTVPWRSARNVLAGAAIMVAPTVAMDLTGTYALGPGGAVAVLSGCLYVATLYGLGELREEEIALTRSVVGQLTGHGERES